MATLSSDDTESPSSIELLAGQPRESAPAMGEAAQQWQLIRLCLNTERVRIESPEAEGFTLCRQPKDEPALLIAELEQLIAAERKTVLFEPQEPSFELNFQRSHHDGIKFEAWIDAGNAQTGFYRWDAAGIRFFTTCDLLRTFVEELRRDFGLAAVN